jgi:hypothetical protein
MVTIGSRKVSTMQGETPRGLILRGKGPVFLMVEQRDMDMEFSCLSFVSWVIIDFGR